jgi:hypothetical protein
MMYLEEAEDASSSDDGMGYLVAFADAEDGNEAHANPVIIDDEPPEIIARPAHLGEHDVYDGQRFHTLQDADDAVALLFNRHRRKLCRPHRSTTVLELRCSTPLVALDGGDDKCTWMCRVRHRRGAEARWGHDVEQAEAGFVFIELERAQHHHDCLPLPDDARGRCSRAQNVKTASMPRFVREYVRQHLHDASVAGVRRALEDKLFLDPGYSTAKRVHATLMADLMGHPVRSYWKLQSWYSTARLLPAPTLTDTSLTPY